MWREKHIRWAWWLIGFNIFISVVNIFFSYGHYLKHEYWSLVVSLLLVTLNSWVAYSQYKGVQRMRAELKELTWRLLSTPSERLS